MDDKRGISGARGRQHLTPSSLLTIYTLDMGGMDSLTIRPVNPARSAADKGHMSAIKAVVGIAT